MDRRTFNKFGFTLLSSTSLGFWSCNGRHESIKPKLENNKAIQLSLAQWSFHRAMRSGTLDNLSFISKAKALGFQGVEFVNQFFPDKANDFQFLKSLKERAKEEGITPVLIMVDNEGSLADPDNEARLKAIDNHKKWIKAAQYLGCHSIRVNLFGEGTRDEMKDHSIESLKLLGTSGKAMNINVLVENHGQYSSDGSWMVDVMSSVNMSNVGTLPDFGNFCIKREGGQLWGTACIEYYDIYKGVNEMMPFAKAVSAKSFNFDESGNETDIDFKKMISIIKNHNFKGFIGIEYEGDQLSEEEGIKKTKVLVERNLF